MLYCKKIPRIILNILSWHIQYYLFNRSFPLAMGIFTTTRCNMKCIMCTIWRNKNKEDISFRKMKNIIDGVTPGLSYISFSGGEPLLLKDIFEMIIYAGQKVPYVHLVTNGALITKETAMKLQECGLSEISISLDGDRDFHEYVRGTKGIYEKVIEAISLIKKYSPKIKIVINTVLFPQYLEQVYYVMKLVKENDIFMKVQAVNEHFYFENMESADRKVLIKEQNKYKINKLVSNLKKNKYILNSRYYFDYIGDYFTGNLKSYLSLPKCILPYFFLEVNANGYMSPCMYGTGWSGGMYFQNNDFKRKLNSTEFKNIQKGLGECNKCNLSMYICYWEPLVVLPLSHFIKYSLLYRRKPYSV